MSLNEIWFELLNLVVSVMQNRIEVEFAEVYALGFEFCRFCSFFIAVGNSATKTGSVRMTEDDQDIFHILIISRNDCRSCKKMFFDLLWLNN